MDKKLKYYILVIIALLRCSTIFGCIIDGPANVRDKPNGTVIFSLNDNVYTKEMNSDNEKWKLLNITFLISEEEYNAKIIKKGKIIKNLKGQFIGKLLVDYKPKDTYGEGIWFNWADEPGTSKVYKASINGFIQIKNIKQINCHSQIISRINDKKIDISNYKQLINLFNFNEKTYSEDVKLYYKEEDFLAPSPLTENILVFYKNKLYLYASYKSSPINNKQYKKYKKKGTNTIIMYENIKLKIDPSILKKIYDFCIYVP